MHVKSSKILLINLLFQTAGPWFFLKWWLEGVLGEMVSFQNIVFLGIPFICFHIQNIYFLKKKFFICIAFNIHIYKCIS